MTATVISLDSRRRQPTTAGTCSACQLKLDGMCFPHRLESLSQRLRGHLETDELLVPIGDFHATLTDAIDVLDGITAECLPGNERNTR